MRIRLFLPTLVLALSLAACGRGGSTPPPSPEPSPTPQNPCLAAALEPEDPAAQIPPAPDPRLAERKRDAIDGANRWRVLDDLWRHRAGEIIRSGSRREPVAGLTAPDTPASPRRIDIGDIAVLQDEGDLLVPANAFDLSSAGLRFTRNGEGGYDVQRIDGTFRSTLGTRLMLDDDDSRQVDVPFSFSFYGRVQQTAFVNSDGNVTFEEEDRASTERNVARLLTGPPRVSPFLADLDPTTGTGRVFVHAAADQYTVTWCSVRGFDSQRVTTVQATLLPNGSIEFKFGDVIVLPDTIVALSPGRTGDFRVVNLSDQGPTAGGSGAVGERFAERAELDTIATTRKFYATHSDDYDQVVLWTDAPLIRDAFAYETTVANEVRGIGIDVYDLSRNFGSGGRLRSLVVMDFIGKYPNDPTQRFLGENNTLSVLGQETGHRWLAFLEFRNHTGMRSDTLLGRGAAHWSFFFDSDASVMEGNDIQDLGGGSFRTVTAVQRYSRLDQYAMGILGESEVPPFFYVENPTNISPIRDADDSPQVGVTFNGTRRDVLIQDVVAVHSPRVPSAAESPRLHRQAFVFLVGAGRQPDNAHISKLEQIRVAWEAFFLQATDGRMRVDTTLR